MNATHDRFFCCYKLSEHLFILYYLTIHTYYNYLLSNKRLSSPVLVHVHYFAVECFDSWDSRSLWFPVWSCANQDIIKCFNFMIFVILTDVYIPPNYQIGKNILSIKCIRRCISCGNFIVNPKYNGVHLHNRKRNFQHK